MCVEVSSACLLSVGSGNEGDCSDGRRRKRREAGRLAGIFQRRAALSAVFRAARQLVGGLIAGGGIQNESDSGVRYCTVPYRTLRTVALVVHRRELGYYHIVDQVHLAISRGLYCFKKICEEKEGQNGQIIGTGVKARSRAARHDSPDICRGHCRFTVNLVVEFTTNSVPSHCSALCSALYNRLYCVLVTDFAPTRMPPKHNCFGGVNFHFTLCNHPNRVAHTKPNIRLNQRYNTGFIVLILVLSF